MIHYFWVIFSKTSEKICLKIYHLHPVKFFSLELLTDIGMFLMVEKGIRGGIYHAIDRYAGANEKYKKDYDKNKELLYLKYWDANNFSVWEMSQKFPVNKFE